MADWIKPTDGFPDADSAVTVRTPTGDYAASLRIPDEAVWPVGSYWETTAGDRLELGDVLAWHR